MFDGLKGLAGMAGIMRDLPRLKATLDDVKVRLDTIHVSAVSAGGAVRATVTCKFRVVSIELDGPTLESATRGDAESASRVSNQIVEAVNAAIDMAKQRASDEFARAADELGIPVPPGGLAGLM
jgi:DNA-binding protein YbaB